MRWRGCGLAGSPAAVSVLSDDAAGFSFGESFGGLVPVVQAVDEVGFLSSGGGFTEAVVRWVFGFACLFEDVQNIVWEEKVCFLT